MTEPGTAALLESWTLSLHSKSPRTITLYRRIVTWFVDFLVATGRPDGAPGDLLAVTRQDVEAWFASQRADGLATATIRSRWIALRNFYGWATDEDEVDENPMRRVKVDKADPPPIPVISEDDLRALLKACEGKDFTERRDMAMIRVFAATGLRLSEVGALALADVDLTQRVLFVRHGKGDKARFARFDPATAQALDRYKRARGRHKHAALPWLWLSRLGRLSDSAVPQMLDRRAAMAGIGHIHPHMFRHSWADRWLTNGGSEGDLQKLGGWESAVVMRRYGSARAVDRALAAYDDVMGGGL